MHLSLMFTGPKFCLNDVKYDFFWVKFVKQLAAQFYDLKLQGVYLVSAQETAGFMHELSCRGVTELLPFNFA